MTKPLDRPIPEAVGRLWERRSSVTPFAVPGAASVLTGGIVAAAIAAPTPTRHGVWAVAYLVLVMGVCQLALGAGQALLAATPLSTPLAVATSTLFNAANLAVLAGVIADRPLALNVGSVLLMAALALFLYSVRHSTHRGWPLHSYRVIVALLVLSIPIGLVVTTLGPR